MKCTEKQLARAAIHNATRDGKLKKPDKCSVCGKQGLIEAHHKNYSEPFNVVWLCADCHRLEHGVIRKYDLYIDEAKYLRSQGLSYRLIGEKLGISKSQAHKWLKYGIPHGWASKRKAEEI